jgi:peptide deformylase
MEIKLLKEGDEVLRQVAEPYNFESDGDPAELVRAMTKIMIENNGIGLAAPQVNVLKRLFIMGNDQRFYVCINPEIVSYEGEERDLEGCLSFPDLWMRVKRHQSVVVKYQTISGEVTEARFEGLIGRVFQHELDHLDGICFDTRVGPTTLDLAREKRRRKSR